MEQNTENENTHDSSESALNNLVMRRDKLREQEKQLTLLIKVERKRLTRKAIDPFKEKWQAAIKREESERRAKKMMRLRLYKALKMLGLSNNDIADVLKIGKSRMQEMKCTYERYEAHYGEWLQGSDA